MRYKNLIRKLNHRIRNKHLFVFKAGEHISIKNILTETSAYFNTYGNQDYCLNNIVNCCLGDRVHPPE